MKKLALVCITTIAVAGFAARGDAAVVPTYAFSPARAPHPLAADPSLSDPAWQAGAVPSNGPWQNVTTRGPGADVTAAYLLYDDRNLYVGFIAKQKSAPIVATQTTNDVGYGTDDFVGVGIDPSGAGSQAYIFEATPRGVRYEQASENVRYRPQWQTAAQTAPGEWRAVMVIPLDVLRLRPGTGQTWRINFFRNIAGAGEHYVWAYNGAVEDAPAGIWPGFHDIRFWAGASGMAVRSTAASRPKPRLELYGLESAGAGREQFQQADGSFAREAVRPVGLDLSYPIASTINVVGTVNPDFSNVEIDQQTIAPQEFRRQLTEYRPFFAQGANYLNPSPSNFTNYIAPQNATFYSPSIGPFDAGAKLEGTLGFQSFGAMMFRGYDRTIGESFDDTVFGYKHALPDERFQYWGQGVLAHHSLRGSDDTVEVGAKGRNLNTRFVWSFDTALERGTWVPQGVAHSTSTYVGVHRENYVTLVGFADLSPNYNPIDGYTIDSDIRGPFGFVNLVGSTASMKNWGLFLGGDRLRDRSNAVHQADAVALVNATFKNKFSINGAGPTISMLRGYDVPSGPNCTGPSAGTNFFSGFPCYRNGRTLPFNLMSLPVGYGDGTPTPVDVSANWGRFGTSELHLYTASTSRPLGSRATLGLEYDGTYERDRVTGALESQWLRRISLGVNTGSDSNLSISLRGINGVGGFAPQQGLNLAGAFHMRLRNGDLYVNFGTPAAGATLDRTIVKYVVRAGGDAGT